jgi:hypothetical protein
MKNTLYYLLISSSCFAAVNVPLTVREALYSGSTAGIARGNEPVTVGVPLPDSAGIRNTSGLALSGATAAQFSVEGTWPSGNIKWLKVRAIVPSLSAGGTVTLTLTDSGSGNFGGSNLATDNGATITVATGAATFTIKKANFNGLDSVTVGSSQIVLAGQSQGVVLLGPDPTAAYPGNATCSPTAGGTACTTVYASSNDASSTCTIEENGPAMSVLKCSGALVDGASHTYMRHTTRLYFYSGKSYTRTQVVLRNAEYGTSNTFATATKGFQGLEFRVKTNLTGSLSYNIANHTATPSSGTLNAAGGTDYAYIYQAESALMKFGNWCGSGTSISCVTPSPLSGYSVVANGAAVTTGTASQYPAGWANIENASGAGVEIGQYQFAAYGNKSLEFRGGGNDVRVGLWASENNTTSTSALTANKPYYQLWPQWNIQEAVLNFHGSTLSSAAATNAHLSYQHYLVAAAAPSHYNASGVFPFPLLDPAEETAYFNALDTAAPPATTKPPLEDMGLSRQSPSQYYLNIWRAYAWEAGGGGNQMEFHLSRLYNLIRRGWTGGFLDTAHFYKMVVEVAYPMSDGFNWRNRTGEVDSSAIPTAVSANAAQTIINRQQKYEHDHTYGASTYYFMTGDETIKEGLIEGAKDHFLSTATVVDVGKLWNSRAMGTTLMHLARLNDFMAAIGDTDAPLALTQGQKIFTNQIFPDLCVATPSGNFPAGCTTGSLYSTAPGGRGVSSLRGVPFAYGDSITQQGGCTLSGIRASSAFTATILMNGMYEFRRAYGPSWQYYNKSFDYAYGIAKWAQTEMFKDTGAWTGSGSYYYEALDHPNSCDGLYYQIKNLNSAWGAYKIFGQYEGSTSWKNRLNMVLQRYIHDGATEEAYLYTIQDAIYSALHPSGSVLQTVPVSNFVDNGGGSYTISWAVPTGTQSYRVKWGPRQIVDWIGFDPGSNTFTGNPATTMNWFAATDATGIPAPSGTTQSLTISTGASGLTAANFMVKAYVSGSGSTPPPSDLTPPTVSMTAPAAGATVSGTVTVQATATDNVAMAGVQFKLDGANLGSMATGSGPSYSVSWNSTGAANGAHTLSATATDAAGNVASSTTVSVTVNNVVAAPVLSSVAASAISASTATVTWTTNVASDSQVVYGLTAAYGLATPLVATAVTSHSVALSGLTASTTYHFQAISKNSAGTAGNSADVTFTTAAASVPPPSGGGTAVPLNTWSRINNPTGWRVEILGYDKSEYVDSRKSHCVWGAYKQWLSSEHNNAMVCYSYSENRWNVLENNGYWHSTHAPGVGHSVSVWAYMPDKDAMVYQTDGSGSNSVENFFGGWWWYDVGGLSGQNRTFSPRPWLGSSTPLVEMMTYDRWNKKLIFYDQTGSIQVCDPNTNSCAKPSISGTAPPTFLTSPNMIYNSSDHKMYIWGGGQANMFTLACGTTACTSMVGAQLTVTCSGVDCTNGKPQPRLAAGMAYSSVDNVIMVVGGIPGYAASTAFSDTWIFDPTTNAWTEQTPAAAYVTSRNLFTSDRLSYDPDSNVFILVSLSGYDPLLFAYPYSAAQNYGRISTTYTPAVGSLNRTAPTATSQSWSFDPAITSGGGNVYLGWVESGANADNSTCGQTHHPVIQSSPYSTNWTYYPGGTFAQQCVSIDPEASGATNASKLRLTLVGGTLWEAHEKINGNQNYNSSSFARYWNGSAWIGGQVGCYSGACSGSVRQNPQALIAVGNTPTLAVVEWNRSSYAPESYLYVSQWSGSAWAALGTRLNTGGAGTQVLEASLATNGTVPAACWSEQNDGQDRATIVTTPKIWCAQWSGSAWTKLGSSALNQTAGSWASDPSMTYAGGKYYVSWTERTTAGNNRLYAARWDGSSWTVLGGGILNINATTGWAAHSSLATDGTNVFLAWEEQTALGQKSLGFVKKWDGTSWSLLGSALNADPVNGSAAGISLAVGQGAPTAIWAELSYGNLRQTYAKQWNGTSWQQFGSSSVPPPPPPASAGLCDLNSDGLVNATDVQIAIDQALGITPCTNADLIGNGQCNVVDVQRVINATMGAACKVGP